MNLTFKDKGSPFLMTMFQKILISCQLALVFGVVISMFFGAPATEENSVLGLRYMTMAFFAGAILLSFSFVYLKKGKQSQAGTIFLVVTTSIVSYSAWVGGGLHSVTVICFPVLLLLAGLFTETLVFFLVGFVLIGMIILMGMGDVLNDVNNPIAHLVTAKARIIGFTAITVTAGYAGWIFGRDMRGAFQALNKEHQLVVESQDVIQVLAYNDALTGLSNRLSAKKAYEDMLDSMDFEKERIAFYFIDLDNFKVINDLFDHEAGDQLLVTIAKRLKRLTREEDVACRLGGDEFVVFVRARATFDFDGLAKRVMSAVAQPHYILGAEAEVTASVGVALISEPGMSFDEVRKKSDMAMYKAKQSGKNKYHYYSESLHTEYMKSLNVLNGLKDALAEGFLDLNFQPQINLATSKVDSAEALLRWNRGNPYGFGPDDFIPVIESTELIHDIGAWVLQEACRTCKAWHEQGYQISVAVNVSALQITRQNFYEVVRKALRDSGLAARFLEIELTEHVLITENMEVRSRLKALKKLGVKLAIDDFGTGYSNMNYLTRLKVDVLKLDKSFISGINDSRDSLVIVTAIIEMASVLGMKVIAEGVESMLQRDTLKGLGCSLGQGYLWAKAMPSKALVEFLGTPLDIQDYTSDDQPMKGLLG